MGKTRITYEIIAGVLSLCTIGGTTAMCVPGSQTVIADYTAENLSPKYQASVELTEELKNQIVDLRFNVENLNNLLETTQGKLDQANSKISNLESTLLEKNNLLLEKETKITELEKDLESLQDNISSLTKEKNKIQAQYEAGLITIEERDNTIASLNTQLEEKTTLLTQKQEQIATLQGEVTTLQNNIQTLEQKKQSLQEAITQLSEQKAELEQQVATLQAKVTQLESENTLLKERLQAAAEYKRTIEKVDINITTTTFVSSPRGIPCELSAFDLTAEDVIESIILKDTFDNTTTSLSFDDLNSCVLYPYHVLIITQKDNDYVKAEFLNGGDDLLDASCITRTENTIMYDFSKVDYNDTRPCQVGFVIKETTVSTVFDTLTGTYSQKINEGLTIRLDLTNRTYRGTPITAIFKDKFLIDSELFSWSYDSDLDAFHITGVDADYILTKEDAS